MRRVLLTAWVLGLWSHGAWAQRADDNPNGPEVVAPGEASQDVNDRLDDLETTVDSTQQRLDRDEQQLSAVRTQLQAVQAQAGVAGANAQALIDERRAAEASRPVRQANIEQAIDALNGAVRAVAAGLFSVDDALNDAADALAAARRDASRFGSALEVVNLQEAQGMVADVAGWLENRNPLYAQQALLSALADAQAALTAISQSPSAR